MGPEGYLCPSDVKYAMPKRARNVNGEWRVVVNDVHYYTQTARMETCLTPGKLIKNNFSLKLRHALTRLSITKALHLRDHFKKVALFPRFGL